jgi:hypothetical protein
MALLQTSCWRQFFLDFMSEPQDGWQVLQAKFPCRTTQIRDIYVLFSGR